MTDMGRGSVRHILVSLVLLLPALAFADHELENRDLRKGRALYAKHCASCHGARLEGQPNWRRPGKDGIRPAPPHNETGHTWHHDNQYLFDYTKLGGKAQFEARGLPETESGMPGSAEDLTDDAIWDILAYIRSTWSDRIRRIQATTNPRHQR